MRYLQNKRHSHTYHYITTDHGDRQYPSYVRPTIFQSTHSAGISLLLLFQKPCSEKRPETVTIMQ